MRSLLAFALVLAAWAGSARSEEAEAFFGLAPMEGAVLDTQRGGTETTDETGAVTNSVIQGNSTSQNASNTNNTVSIGANAAKLSGDIHRAEVSNNYGITAVMQNTGDLVNMTNATSLNIFLQ